MPPLALIVTYRARPGQGDALEAALKRMGQMVKEHEPTCLLFQVGRSRTDRDLFHLHEVYRDDAALVAHRETPHFKEIVVGQARPLLAERVADECDLVVE